MKEFEVTIKLKNNLIKRRRIELSLSPRQAAEKAGIGYEIWLKYEAMLQYPISGKGEWKPSARKLSEFLGFSPEELFPNCILAVKKTTVVAEVNALEMIALSGVDKVPCSLPSPETMAQKSEVSGILCEAMSELTSREQLVIKKLLGFDGGGGRDDHTLTEISEDVGITGSQTQVAINSAFRKIRKMKTILNLREDYFGG
jgi:DNA-directed RNA polymerase specialized sigma subunit